MAWYITESTLNLRQYLHYAREIWNPALFLRLGLPSTLICYQNAAFPKRSLNRRNLKTPAFLFRVDGQLFENGRFFWKRCRHDNHVVSLTEFFLLSNYFKSKMPVVDAFSQAESFLRRPDWNCAVTLEFFISLPLAAFIDPSAWRVNVFPSWKRANNKRGD